MKINFKLSILFFTITIIPVFILSLLSFKNIQESIEEVTINHLKFINNSDKNSFDTWLFENKHILENLSKTETIKKAAGEISPLNNHDEILQTQLKTSINKQRYKELIILNPENGEAFTSTTKKNIGKYHDNHQYFKKGLKETFVQTIYFDMETQKPAMTIATPIKNNDNKTIAVLAGQLTLEYLSKIINSGKYTGKTEDSYLVNNFYFFITEPRFGDQYALKKTTKAKGIKTALTSRTTYIGSYKNYRGKTVTGICRWIPELKLCLVTEIDKSESHQLIFKLKKKVITYSTMISILSLMLGWITGHIITKPLSPIFNATKKIGNGHFNIELDNQGGDEISELARALESMGEKLQKTVVSRDKLLREVAQKEKAESQLRKMLIQLKKSNDDLEQFAYVASHDLQEPLRMVSSYTQLLNDKYFDELDEKAKKYLFYARDGAERMQSLIQALLSFSRINTHGADFAEADLNSCLVDALKNLEKTINDKNPVITRDTLPSLICDKNQITLVFQNIVSNSLKFSKTNNPQINISVNEKSYKWIFSVSDNGIGITEEHKDKIFVIFKRLHTRTEYPGTGIGLAICKKIIERHGGIIWFESKIETGSTFYFTLPKNLE